MVSAGQVRRWKSSGRVFEVVERVDNGGIAAPWIVKELVSERRYEMYRTVIEAYSDLLMDRWP